MDYDVKIPIVQFLVPYAFVSIRILVGKLAIMIFNPPPDLPLETVRALVHLITSVGGFQIKICIFYIIKNVYGLPMQ